MNSKMFWVAATCAALLVSCGGTPAPTPEAKKATAPQIDIGPIPLAGGEVGGLAGKAVFLGEAPKPRTISMDATPVCAKMHKGPLLAEDIILGKAGELKNVFVWIKSGLTKRDYPMPKEPVKLDQSGCIYTPHVLGLLVNQPLYISNSDDTNHNIHPMPRINKEWNESQPPKGDVKIKTFDKEETPPILFKCNVHPWMRAWVGVVSHPFFAVTGEDGTFAIKNVPPGEYQVSAWHERFGTMDVNVRIEAKLTPTVNLTFRPQ